MPLLTGTFDPVAVVLVLLGLTGLVAPEDLFNGFSSNAVICVIATMILSAGLDRTGALNRLAAWILRRSKGDVERMVGITSVISGVVSSTMQNRPSSPCSCRWPRDCRHAPASPWAAC